MPKPIAHDADSPPAPRRRGVAVLTAFLLGTWFVFTFFATPMTPVVISIAEWVEVTGGFDVMQGEETYTRPGTKPARRPGASANDEAGR